MNVPFNDGLLYLLPSPPQVSPTPSEESIEEGGPEDELDPDDPGHSPFMPKPFCVYSGHLADLLDIAWSKNYFLLTSSMDKVGFFLNYALSTVVSSVSQSVTTFFFRNMYIY